MTQASVLIVDDDPFARQTLSEWLRRKNFSVIEAENGWQAMERIRKNYLDIVISDVVMPVMDGIQFLERSQGCQGKHSNYHDFRCPFTYHRFKRHDAWGFGLPAQALHA